MDQIICSLLQSSAKAVPELKHHVRLGQSDSLDAKIESIDKSMEELLKCLAVASYTEDPVAEPFVRRCVATVGRSCGSGHMTLGAYVRLKLLYTVGTAYVSRQSFNKVYELLNESVSPLELNKLIIATSVVYSELDPYNSSITKVLDDTAKKVCHILDSSCFQEDFELAYLVFEFLHFLVAAKSFEDVMDFMTSYQSIFQTRKSTTSVYSRNSLLKPDGGQLFQKLSECGFYNNADDLHWKWAADKVKLL